MFAQTLVGVFALSTATAFIIPPAKATDPPPKPTVEQQLDELSAKMTGVNNNIAGVKESIKSINLRLDDIIRSMATTEQHDALKRQVEQLKLDVDNLRAQLNNQAVTTRSSPLGANMPGAMPGPMRLGPTGTLRVANRNFFDTEVFVNGAPYIVPAFATTDVTVPAGAFTYAVPSNMPGSRTRTMPAGQVYGITITP